MGARCSIARPSRRARPMPINSARFAELRQGRDTAEARFRAAEARVGELNEELTAKTRILGEQGEETEEMRALADRGPQVLVGELEDRHPMFLLPVRIETRIQVSGDRNELRVRIFPDEIAITAHRRELTGAELAD